jgi:hypothetical protein
LATKRDSVFMASSLKGAGANPILPGGRRSCSTYLVAAMPRWAVLKNNLTLWA